MEKQNDSNNSRGLTYQGRMALAWEVQSDVIEANQVDQNDKNEHLLRALLLTHDSHRDMGDEQSDRGVELVRVEAKLDLLLDMVSQLLKKEQCAAFVCAVELWLAGLSWTTDSDNLPEIGQLLWLYLYVDPRLAQPLTLSARVVGLEAREGLSEITVIFESLDESVTDLLGKLIFRQHRRAVAQQKAEQRSHQ